MEIEILDSSPINIVSTNMNSNQAKCKLCQKFVSLNEYSNHTKSCRFSYSKVDIYKMKKCKFCQKAVPQKDYLDHIRLCDALTNCKSCQKVISFIGDFF